MKERSKELLQALSRANPHRIVVGPHLHNANAAGARRFGIAPAQNQKQVENLAGRKSHAPSAILPAAPRVSVDCRMGERSATHHSPTHSTGTNKDVGFADNNLQKANDMLPKIGFVFAGLLTVATILPSQIAAAASLKTLYSFAGLPDGRYPGAGLTYYGGVLYGTTQDGGTGNCLAGTKYAGCGTVFTVNPTTGAEAVVHNFQDGQDGALPTSGLVQANGLLYGSTSFGGKPENGTVFKLDPSSGLETVVYAFKGGLDGNSPAGDMVLMGNSLFGTTEFGGGKGCGGGGCGVVYEISLTTGAENVLYRFQGEPDGNDPNAGLAALNGLLYGTTLFGGLAKCHLGCGIVFQLDPSTGAESVLYRFSGGTADGFAPEDDLLADSGLLLGTTYDGGAYGDGVAFAVNPLTGAETILHSFGGVGGKNPDGGLSFGPDSVHHGAVPDSVHHGVVFGLTKGGGVGNHGTAYAIQTSSGTETVLHSFTNTRNGAAPSGNLLYEGGFFYGTTVLGGASGFGTVFRLKP